jgi:predicted NBD/HSP70 family sugar kinase
MMPPVTVVDQAALARHNRSIVLGALRWDGPTSRTALASRLQLAKGTISVIVDELLRDGLIREIGTVTGAGPGRPARLLEYDASVHHVGAVHLGVSRTHVVIADGLGRVLAESREQTRRQSPDQMMSHVAQSIEDIARRAALPLPGSIAVCVPGHVDNGSGICRSAPNLGWRDAPVASLLGARTGAAVSVINDAQAALSAECADGAAAGETDVVLLYAGDGVSAALLDGGRVVRGAAGGTGEIGHCPVDGATGRCGCGRRGCLETVASSRAVVASVRAALMRREPSTLSARRLSVGDVLSAAQAGDAVAVTALTAAAQHLGRACGVLVNLLNPRVIVLAGELCRGGDVFVDPLRAEAKRVALPESWSTVQVRRAAFADDAEVMGALHHALGGVDLLEPTGSVSA